MSNFVSHDHCELHCCNVLVHLAYALDHVACQENCCDVSDDHTKKACVECRDAVVKAVEACLKCYKDCCENPVSSGLLKGKRVNV